MTDDRHDDLHDRREHREQRAVAHTTTYSERDPDAARGPGVLGPALLRIATDHTEVSVAEDNGTPGHVMLTLSDLRRNRTLGVSMSYLNIDLLSYGLRRAIEGLEREGQRR